MVFPGREAGTSCTQVGAADGAAWMGDDSRLYRWVPGNDDWSLVADLDAEGLFDISRLAFSPAGDRLAVVARRPPAGTGTRIACVLIALRASEN